YSLMAKLVLAVQHPEALFLPENYAYIRNDNEQHLLRRGHDALDNALHAARESSDANRPLQSKDETLVLASIVEKEIGIARDRMRITGVFLRRMKLGMRLQTDPTVIYGMGST